MAEIRHNPRICICGICSRSHECTIRHGIPWEVLRDNITKVLIVSNFVADFGVGKTAEEINTLEERAMKYFNGVKVEGITINFFRNRISRDVALIMDIIEKETCPLKENRNG